MLFSHNRNLHPARSLELFVAPDQLTAICIMLLVSVETGWRTITIHAEALIVASRTQFINHEFQRASLSNH